MKIRSFFKIFGNYLSLLFSSLSCMFTRKGGGFINSVAMNSQYLLDSYFNKQYIFIHINKNGGSSIEKALQDKDQVHLDAYTLKNFMGTKTFNSKFKFAFVRNPYDRVVSQYHYRYGQNQTGLKDKNISFKKWVNFTYVKKDPDYYNYPAMFQNQLDWLTDREGKLLVDFVGKFETLQQDFDTICEQLDIKKTKLPHKRKSTRKKGYLEYYDRELLDTVYKIYERDFKYFNYEKQ